MGPLSGLSVDQVEKQIKGNKQTCYCDIYLMELSSRGTMRSHVAGMKHQKKEMMVKDWEDKMLWGQSDRGGSEEANDKG